MKGRLQPEAISDAAQNAFHRLRRFLRREEGDAADAADGTSTSAPHRETFNAASRQRWKSARKGVSALPGVNGGGGATSSIQRRGSRRREVNAAERSSKNIDGILVVSRKDFAKGYDGDGANDGDNESDEDEASEEECEWEEVGGRGVAPRRLSRNDFLFLSNTIDEYWAKAQERDRKEEEEEEDALAQQQQQAQQPLTQQGQPETGGNTGMGGDTPSVVSGSGAEDPLTTSTSASTTSASYSKPPLTNGSGGMNGAAAPTACSGTTMLIKDTVLIAWAAALVEELEFDMNFYAKAASMSATQGKGPVHENTADKGDNVLSGEQRVEDRGRAGSAQPSSGLPESASVSAASEERAAEGSMMMAAEHELDPSGPISSPMFFPPFSYPTGNTHASIVVEGQTGKSPIADLALTPLMHSVEGGGKMSGEPTPPPPIPLSAGDSAGKGNRRTPTGKVSHSVSRGATTSPESAVPMHYRSLSGTAGLLTSNSASGILQEGSPTGLSMRFGVRASPGSTGVGSPTQTAALIGTASGGDFGSSTRSLPPAATERQDRPQREQRRSRQPLSEAKMLMILRALSAVSHTLALFPLMKHPESNEVEDHHEEMSQKEANGSNNAATAGSQKETPSPRGEGDREGQVPPRAQKERQKQHKPLFALTRVQTALPPPPIRILSTVVLKGDHVEPASSSSSSSSSSVFSSSSMSSEGTVVEGLGGGRLRFGCGYSLAHFLLISQSVLEALLSFSVCCPMSSALLQACRTTLLIISCHAYQKGQCPFGSHVTFPTTAGGEIVSSSSASGKTSAQGEDFDSDATGAGHSLENVSPRSLSSPGSSPVSEGPCVSSVEPHPLTVWGGNGSFIDALLEFLLPPLLSSVLTPSHLWLAALAVEALRWCDEIRLDCVGEGGGDVNDAAAASAPSSGSRNQGAPESTRPRRSTLVHAGTNEGSPAELGSIAAAAAAAAAAQEEEETAIKSPPPPSSSSSTLASDLDGAGGESQKETPLMHRAPSLYGDGGIPETTRRDMARLVLMQAYRIVAASRAVNPVAGATSFSGVPSRPSDSPSAAANGAPEYAGQSSPQSASIGAEGNGGLARPNDNAGVQFLLLPENEEEEDEEQWEHRHSRLAGNRFDVGSSPPAWTKLMEPTERTNDNYMNSGGTPMANPVLCPLGSASGSSNASLNAISLAPTALLLFLSLLNGLVRGLSPEAKRCVFGFPHPKSSPMCESKTENGGSPCESTTVQLASYLNGNDLMLQQKAVDLWVNAATQLHLARSSLLVDPYASAAVASGVNLSAFLVPQPSPSSASEFGRSRSGADNNNSSTTALVTPATTTTTTSIHRKSVEPKPSPGVAMNTSPRLLPQPSSSGMSVKELGKDEGIHSQASTVVPKLSTTTAFVHQRVQSAGQSILHFVGAGGGGSGGGNHGSAVDATLGRGPLSDGTGSPRTHASAGSTTAGTVPGATGTADRKAKKKTPAPRPWLTLPLMDLETLTWEMTELWMEWCVLPSSVALESVRAEWKSQHASALWFLLQERQYEGQRARDAAHRRIRDGSGEEDKDGGDSQDGLEWRKRTLLPQFYISFIHYYRLKRVLKGDREYANAQMDLQMFSKLNMLQRVQRVAIAPRPWGVGLASGTSDAAGNATGREEGTEKLWAAARHLSRCVLFPPELLFERCLSYSPERQLTGLITAETTREKEGKENRKHKTSTADNASEALPSSPISAYYDGLERLAVESLFRVPITASSASASLYLQVLQGLVILSLSSPLNAKRLTEHGVVHVLIARLLMHDQTEEAVFSGQKDGTGGKAERSNNEVTEKKKSNSKRKGGIVMNRRINDGVLSGGKAVGEGSPEPENVTESRKLSNGNDSKGAGGGIGKARTGQIAATGPWTRRRKRMPPHFFQPFAEGSGLPLFLQPLAPLYAINDNAEERYDAFMFGTADEQAVYSDRGASPSCPTESAERECREGKNDHDDDEEEESPEEVHFLSATARPFNREKSDGKKGSRDSSHCTNQAVVDYKELVRQYIQKRRPLVQKLLWQTPMEAPAMSMISDAPVWHCRRMSTRWTPSLRQETLDAIGAVTSSYFACDVILPLISSTLRALRRRGTTTTMDATLSAPKDMTVVEERGLLHGGSVPAEDDDEEVGNAIDGYILQALLHSLRGRHPRYDLFRPEQREHQRINEAMRRRRVARRRHCGENTHRVSSLTLSSSSTTSSSFSSSLSHSSYSLDSSSRSVSSSRSASDTYPDYLHGKESDLAELCSLSSRSSRSPEETNLKHRRPHHRRHSSRRPAAEPTAPEKGRSFLQKERQEKEAEGKISKGHGRDDAGRCRSLENAAVLPSLPPPPPKLSQLFFFPYSGARQGIAVPLRPLPHPWEGYTAATWIYPLRIPAQDGTLLFSLHGDEDESVLRLYALSDGASNKPLYFRLVQLRRISAAEVSSYTTSTTFHTGTDPHQQVISVETEVKPNLKRTTRVFSTLAHISASAHATLCYWVELIVTVAPPNLTSHPSSRFGDENGNSAVSNTEFKVAPAFSANTVLTTPEPESWVHVAYSHSVSHWTLYVQGTEVVTLHDVHYPTTSSSPLTSNSGVYSQQVTGEKLSARNTPAGVLSHQSSGIGNAGASTSSSGGLLLFGGEGPLWSAWEELKKPHHNGRKDSSDHLELLLPHANMMRSRFTPLLVQENNNFHGYSTGFSVLHGSIDASSLYQVAVSGPAMPCRDRVQELFVEALRQISASNGSNGSNGAQFTGSLGALALSTFKKLKKMSSNAQSRTSRMDSLALEAKKRKGLSQQALENAMNFLFLVDIRCHDGEYYTQQYQRHDLSFQPSFCSQGEEETLDTKDCHTLLVNQMSCWVPHSPQMPGSTSAKRLGLSSFGVQLVPLPSLVSHFQQQRTVEEAIDTMRACGSEVTTTTRSLSISTCSSATGQWGGRWGRRAIRSLTARRLCLPLIATTLWVAEGREQAVDVKALCTVTNGSGASPLGPRRRTGGAEVCAHRAGKQVDSKPSVAAKKRQEKHRTIPRGWTAPENHLEELWSMVMPVTAVRALETEILSWEVWGETDAALLLTLATCRRAEASMENAGGSRSGARKASAQKNGSNSMGGGASPLPAAGTTTSSSASGASLLRPHASTKCILSALLERLRGSVWGNLQWQTSVSAAALQKVATAYAAPAEELVSPENPLREGSDQNPDPDYPLVETSLLYGDRDNVRGGGRDGEVERDHHHRRHHHHHHHQHREKRKKKRKFSDSLRSGSIEHEGSEEELEGNGEPGHDELEKDVPPMWSSNGALLSQEALLFRRFFIPGMEKGIAVHIPMLHSESSVCVTRQGASHSSSGDVGKSSHGKAHQETENRIPVSPGVHSSGCIPLAAEMHPIPSEILSHIFQELSMCLIQQPNAELFLSVPHSFTRLLQVGVFAPGRLLSPVIEVLEKLCKGSVEIRQTFQFLVDPLLPDLETFMALLKEAKEQHPPSSSWAFQSSPSSPTPSSSTFPAVLPYHTPSTALPFASPLVSNSTSPHLAAVGVAGTPEIRLVELGLTVQEEIEQRWWRRAQTAWEFGRKSIDYFKASLLCMLYEVSRADEGMLARLAHGGDTLHAMENEHLYTSCGEHPEEGIKIHSHHHQRSTEPESRERAECSCAVTDLNTPIFLFRRSGYRRPLNLNFASSMKMETSTMESAGSAISRPASVNTLQESVLLAVQDHHSYYPHHHRRHQYRGLSYLMTLIHGQRIHTSERLRLYSLRILSLLLSSNKKMRTRFVKEQQGYSLWVRALTPDLCTGQRFENNEEQQADEETLIHETRLPLRRSAEVGGALSDPSLSRTAKEDTNTGMKNAEDGSPVPSSEPALESLWDIPITLPTLDCLFHIAFNAYTPAISVTEGSSAPPESSSGGGKNSNTATNSRTRSGEGMNTISHKDMPTPPSTHQSENSFQLLGSGGVLPNAFQGYTPQSALPSVLFPCGLGSVRRTEVEDEEEQKKDDRLEQNEDSDSDKDSDDSSDGYSTADSAVSSSSKRPAPHDDRKRNAPLKRPDENAKKLKRTTTENHSSTVATTPATTAGGGGGGAAGGTAGTPEEDGGGTKHKRIIAIPPAMELVLAAFGALLRRIGRLYAKSRRIRCCLSKNHNLHSFNLCNVIPFNGNVSLTGGGGIALHHRTSSTLSLGSAGREARSSKRHADPEEKRNHKTTAALHSSGARHTSGCPSSSSTSGYHRTGASTPHTATLESAKSAEALADSLVVDVLYPGLHYLEKVLDHPANGATLLSSPWLEWLWNSFGEVIAYRRQLRRDQKKQKKESSRVNGAAAAGSLGISSSAEKGGTELAEGTVGSAASGQLPFWYYLYFPESLTKRVTLLFRHVVRRLTVLDMATNPRATTILRLKSLPQPPDVVQTVMEEVCRHFFLRNGEGATELKHSMSKAQRMIKNLDVLFRDVLPEQQRSIPAETSSSPPSPCPPSRMLLTLSLGADMVSAINAIAVYNVSTLRRYMKNETQLFRVRDRIAHTMLTSIPKFQHEDHRLLGKLLEVCANDWGITVVLLRRFAEAIAARDTDEVQSVVYLLQQSLLSTEGRRTVLDTLGAEGMQLGLLLCDTTLGGPPWSASGTRARHGVEEDNNDYWMALSSTSRAGDRGGKYGKEGRHLFMEEEITSHGYASSAASLSGGGSPQHALGGAYRHTNHNTTSSNSNTHHTHNNTSSFYGGTQYSRLTAQAIEWCRQHSGSWSLIADRIHERALREESEYYGISEEEPGSHVRVSAPGGISGVGSGLPATSPATSEWKLLLQKAREKHFHHRRETRRVVEFEWDHMRRDVELLLQE